MKVRMVTTIDVDPEAWATEYGIENLARVVRADVRDHILTNLSATYVDELRVAHHVTVARPT